MNRFFQLPFVSRLGVILLVFAAFAAAVWTVQARSSADSFLPGTWTKSAGNPVLNTATSGAWDDQFAFAPSVILDGATYKMWYAGSSVANSNRKIGYATSPDGLTWTRQGSSPVLTPGSAGSWDAVQVGFPSVIKDSSTYKMWYTALDASNIGRVGYATSTDGMNWNKYAGNPVLTPGTGSSWDLAYVGSPTVVKIGSLYHMWYRGGISGGIGYATSPDGMVWTKAAGNPVVANGSGGWDDTAYHPRVMYDGMGYHMWYSGCNLAGDLCQLGYATSQNGVQWARKGMVLPQGSTGAWDDESTDHAAVLLVNGTLKMWYSGFDGASYRIGYASAAAAILDHRVFIPLTVK